MKRLLEPCDPFATLDVGKALADVWQLLQEAEELLNHDSTPAWSSGTDCLPPQALGARIVDEKRW